MLHIDGSSTELATKPFGDGCDVRACERVVRCVCVRVRVRVRACVYVCVREGEGEGGKRFV